MNINAYCKRLRVVPFSEFKSFLKTSSKTTLLHIFRSRAFRGCRPSPTYRDFVDRLRKRRSERRNFDIRSGRRRKAVKFHVKTKCRKKSVGTTSEQPKDNLRNNN